MIAQTIQFFGVAPEALYNAWLSTTQHAAMAMDGNHPVTFYRPGVGEVTDIKEGDEIRALLLAKEEAAAFGFTDNTPHYFVNSTILKLVPGKLIVATWKNLGWNLALDKSKATDLESTIILTFKQNIAGSEIQFVQVNVPDYEVRFPNTGETGHLSSLVNTHWSLVYWESMKQYFAKK